MRTLWLVLLGFAINASATSFYKQVDAEGNVTYSDRPSQPGQPALSLPSVNMATPESRRQLDLARQRWDREAREEYDSRMRQWAAAQRTARMGYSRPLSPSPPYPTYASPTYFHPTFYTFNAGSQVQNRSTERRHSPGENRGHRSRR